MTLHALEDYVRHRDWRMVGAAGVLGFAVALAAMKAIDVFAAPVPVLSIVLAALCGALAGMLIAGAALGRHMRRELCEQNLRLDGAINNMSQGLCMFDAQNRLVVWNERYRAMYNIDPLRMHRGMTARDLLDARIAAGTFPLDPERYGTELRAALAQGKSFTLNIELADGRTIAVVNQPMADGGWVATHEDISERRQAVSEMERTRRFLDTIIENVPSPIIVKDISSLRYLLINRAAEDHFGLERSEVLGKTAHDILPPASAAAVEATDRMVVEPGQTIFLDEHVVGTPANGKRIVTATRHAVTGTDGKSQYLITLIRDVTARKRNEQRLAHMAHHDPLTELANRAAFNECIAATLERAAAMGESFAVLSVDLDGFKTVNDVFGHTIGDGLLRAVAQRMAEASEGAFLARVGGDEFALITPTGPQPDGAAALTERLSAALSSEIEVEGARCESALPLASASFRATAAMPRHWSPMPMPLCSARSRKHAAPPASSKCRPTGSCARSARSSRTCARRSGAARSCCIISRRR